MFWDHDAPCRNGSNKIAKNDDLNLRRRHAATSLIKVDKFIHCVIIEWIYKQWNLSVTTTSKIKFITCDLFSNVV